MNYASELCARIAGVKVIAFFRHNEIKKKAASWGVNFLSSVFVAILCLSVELIRLQHGYMVVHQD